MMDLGLDPFDGYLWGYGEGEGCTQVWNPESPRLESLFRTSFPSLTEYFQILNEKIYVECLAE